MTAIIAEPLTQQPDYEAIKTKQQQTWSAGDYAAVGTTLQIVGEQLCETLGLPSGARVLDVAAGNGNATLAAARRFYNVTSTDYVPELLERGRVRAEAEGLSVAFEVADAENLPYGDGAFDAVVSTFGVMFTPDQVRAAHELARVCRRGGRIGLANWTPEGFIGRLFGVIGRHVAPPAGVLPPSRWGNTTALREMFGDSARIVALTPRSFIFRYRSADHFVDFFRTYYGPIHKAFAAVGDGADLLDADIRALLDEFNTAGDGSIAVPSEYVEVVLEPR